MNGKYEQHGEAAELHEQADEKIHAVGLSAHRNESLLRRLVDILQHPAESTQDFLDYALVQAIQMTESKIGYIYHYHENRKEFVLNTWSKEAMAECTIANPATRYELEKTGIWGEAVRQRRPVIVNDFQAANPLKKGCPEGHVQLIKFITVPIFKGDSIVGVIGLANKETNYEESDILQLTLLMKAVWKVTERNQAEEEKARLEVQLQQAQKMESVGRLAGGVAHDFNNMLGIIIGHVELAMDQVDPAQPLHANLEEILKAANHSADLTRQLLAFARKQTIAPKVLDLNATVEGMLKMLRRLIGEDIVLNWQPKADLWPVKVDPSQIDQILANLCVNSRDAIAGVGKMIIETGNRTFDGDYCGVHAGFTPGEYVMMAVSDDGCGLDKKTMANIFEPFFTTKGMGKGTGLGLSTVYGIVKQNRGFIDVYSEPGQGTTFTIYLSRHKGKASQMQKAALAEPAVRGYETILLVEDEPAILELIMIMLEKLGYTVLTAGTPGDSIRMAAGEHAGEIHLLMTDVVMPEMNGKDLAGNLLSLYPHLKHLFMSGYTADVIAHNGIIDEGVSFIQKPFSIKELAIKVREALGYRM